MKLTTATLLTSLLLTTGISIYPTLHLVGQAQSIASPVQWTSFTPDKGGFSVSMPGQPKPNMQTLNTPAGDMNTYFYTSTLEGGKINYTVSYVDLPQGMTQMPADLLLEAIGSGLTGDERVKVLNEQVINLESYPGRAFKIESQNRAIVHHRAYLVKQRIYQIAVEVPAAQEKTLSSDVERFLNSFKLL